MPERCQAQTKEGRPCSATPAANGWCKWHDPALAASRREWSRRGGEGKSNLNRAAKRVPKDLQDVQAVLMRALRDVEGGALEPARANAMGSLARAIVAIRTAGELEERLRELETRAGLREPA